MAYQNAQIGKPIRKIISVPEKQPVKAPPEKVPPVKTPEKKPVPA